MLFFDEQCGLTLVKLLSAAQTTSLTPH